MPELNLSPKFAARDHIMPPVRLELTSNSTPRLESGDGVPEDKEKAAYWLEKAGSQGDDEAKRTSEEVKR